MTNKPFNLAEARAENFEKWLYEACDIMLDFSCENKFDCYSIVEENQLERVVEILITFTNMWKHGQIIVSSKEH